MARIVVPKCDHLEFMHSPLLKSNVFQYAIWALPWHCNMHIIWGMGQRVQTLLPPNYLSNTHYNDREAPKWHSSRYYF